LAAPLGGAVGFGSRLSSDSCRGGALFALPAVTMRPERATALCVVPRSRVFAVAETRGDGGAAGDGAGGGGSRRGVLAVASLRPLAGAGAAEIRAATAGWVRKTVGCML